MYDDAACWAEPACCEPLTGTELVDNRFSKPRYSMPSHNGYFLWVELCVARCSIH